jgi:stage IV sporulation protein FB
MRVTPAVRTVLSLLLYAGIYYLIFRDTKSIVLLLAVIIVHESGHFIAMRSYGYTNVRMLFIPLFGAFVSGKPSAVDPGKKMVVLFAGPLPGIILGMCSAYAYTVSHEHIFYLLALMFIFLNVFNLLPLTPMDGGQMLQILFPDHSRWVQTLFILLTSLALGLAAYMTRNYLLIFLILLMWLRLGSLWRPVIGDVEPDSEKVLTDLQRLYYTVIWLAFMVLPIITLYKIT